MCPGRVPRLQEDRRLAGEADAGRRARRDEIAGRERDEVREVADEVAHVEDERLGVSGLHERAVHPQLEIEDVGIGDLGAVRDVRSHRGQGVADLAGRPLTGDELEVAGAHVVDDRVTGHVVERALARHEAGGAADDDAELDFPVELLRSARPQDRLAGIEDGGVPLREDGWLLGNRLAGLLGVVAVVEADADELAGIGDGRMQPRRVLGHGHPFRDGGDGILAGRASFEELSRRIRNQGGGDGLGSGHASLGERGGQARLEIGDAVTLQRAEPGRLAVLREAHELHGIPPGGKMCGGLYSLAQSYAAPAGRPRN